MKKRYVTREEFDQVIEDLWEEIKYQNDLDRRTDDEATTVGDFLSLGRSYIRKAEDALRLLEGAAGAKSYLRKIAAIFVRSVIYNRLENKDDKLNCSNG